MHTTCLNDIQIQALADGEAGDGAERHAAGCARCAERLRQRRLLMNEIHDTLDAPVPLRAPLVRSVDESLRLIATPEIAAAERGATRLRANGGGFRVQAEGRRRLAYSGLAIAAATLVAVLVVVPMMKGPTTVSASEILAKSARQLAAPVASGVEFLEYELTVDGVPRDVMPEQGDGVYRVVQVLDHGIPGHFHFTSFGPGGAQLTAIAEDPAAARRVMAIRIDGQPYRFELSLPANPTFSEPELQRVHMQATVAMMQASGNQQMQIIDGPAGRQYRIDVPAVSAAAPAAVWDLNEAHVIIDAADYHIVEFAVKGAFLKQAYSLSYRLIRREVKPPADVPADAFEVPVEPGAILIRGEGSPIAPRDALVAALRELAKAKQAR